MARGGARPGSGRPPGAINRATAEAREAAASGGEMPLDYMLRVMRDPQSDVARRDDMAKAAASYVHPRLANVDSTNKIEGSLIVETGVPVAEG